MVTSALALSQIAMPVGYFFMALVQARNVNKTTALAKANQGISSQSLEQAKELEQQRQQTQLKLAYMNIATQAHLELSRQDFQERMARLQFGQQVNLEEARQTFQLKLTQLNHQHQLEIQEFVQRVNLAISQRNLDFQRWRFEQERSLQQELAAYNRETQFTLAAYQRETALQLPQIHKLFENWPLTLVPALILRSHQGEGAIPLRVIISPPQVDFDKFGDTAKGFPKIEKRLAEGLRELLSQNYPLNSPARATELLDGAWDSKRFRGGASIKILFGMLRSEPTLILESEVDGDYLNFRVAYWGLGHDTYCYEQIISRLPYRDILYQSAKSRALKWKHTREKLLAAGLATTPEQVDKLYGQDNPSNLKRLEVEKQLKEAGIDHEVPINYQVNNQDFEVLCQVLVTCHQVVTAWMADAHHLIHADVPPLLPELLPSLLNDESGLPLSEVIQAVVSGYHDLFKALEIERASWIPEQSLQLAQGLAALPDKSWAKKEVLYAIRSWLQQRSPQLEVKDQSLEAMLSAMGSALIEGDQGYLEKIKSCLSTIGQEQAVTQVQSLLNLLQKRKEEGEKEEKRKEALVQEDERANKPRQTLLSLIRELRQVLQSLGMTEKMTALDEVKERVQSNTFKVLVVGEFKTGKSTFINALLGEEVLPSYSLPCTALITSVKWDDKRRALLHFKQSVAGDARKPVQIPVEELEEYVTIKDFDKMDEEARQSPYSHVELFCPLDYLRRYDVEIIDSPGLNENPYRKQITEEYMKRADAVLFVMNSTRLRLSISQHALGHEEIFFICNRFDAIRKRERERVRQYALSQFAPLTKRGGERVFFISAINALDGRLENDQQLVEQSGVPQLEAALATLLSEDRTRLKIRRAVTSLKKVIREARKRITEREGFLVAVTAQARVNQKAELKALRNQLQSINERVDALANQA